MVSQYLVLFCFPSTTAQFGQTRLVGLFSQNKNKVNLWAWAKICFLKINFVVPPMGINKQKLLSVGLNSESSRRNCGNHESKNTRKKIAGRKGKAQNLSVMMMPKSSPVRCTILALVAVAYKREQHKNTLPKALVWSRPNTFRRLSQKSFYNSRVLERSQSRVPFYEEDVGAFYSSEVWPPFLVEQVLSL